MGKSGIEPLFFDAEKHDGTMRDRLQKPDVPVSGERATTLNILMAQYRRQYYRGRFICTKREERIVKEGGERGRRSKRRIVSNPFLDRSSIPKLARATKRWGPHGTASSRKAKTPFLRVGTRLEQGDERCYRLGNIKSLLFVPRGRVRAANYITRICPFLSVY